MKAASNIEVYCRRLARRGGVKRISGNIYDEARKAMMDRLKLVSLPLHTSGSNASQGD